MKTIRTIFHLAILAAAVLYAVSCQPITPGSPNPLDTPETFIVRPESMGQFGPHSEFYPTH